MKTRTILLSSLLACLLAGPAFGAAAEGKASAQQQRMKACNAEAKSKALKGDERRSFMSTCLKGEPAAGSSAGKASARSH